jgi:hypothetical protein
MVEKIHDLFISYEREDGGDSSLLIYTHLAHWFGENSVFRDKQKIPTGSTWQKYLSRQVEGCKGVVIVVGAHWNTPRIQQKLNDPDNWIRKEIACALTNHKPIFPVLMDGVRNLNTGLLPEEIKPAFTTNNFLFFMDGPEFKQSLNRLCTDIADRTGLDTVVFEGRKRAPQYERLISRLDRYKETVCVKQNVKTGKLLYLAVGGRRAGFRHFAVRCALDALNQSLNQSEQLRSDFGRESYRDVSLDWNGFAEIDDPTVRKSEMLSKIAEQLTNDAPFGTDDQIIQRIRQKIANSRQPTVVYATVRSGAGESDKINEWFSIWKSLMPQSQHAASLIVILFVRQGFMARVMPALKKPEMCDCLVDPALGLIEQNHLEEWTENQLRVRATDALYLDVKARWQRLFRFPWSKCRFDDISDTLAQAWVEKRH